MRGWKVDPVVKPDHGGLVKAVHFPNVATAKFGTGLLMVENLRLRSVAFHLAKMCAFELLQQCVDRLMAAFKKETLPGRCPMTVAQLYLADRECFDFIADSCEDNLKVGTAGLRPFEVALNKVLGNFVPDVTGLLVQLPAKGP